MEYDFHVRWTQYLARINASVVNGCPMRGCTAKENEAAMELWNSTPLTELERLALIAWENEPDIHPELQKRKRKVKAAGI